MGSNLDEALELFYGFKSGNLRSIFDAGWCNIYRKEVNYAAYIVIHFGYHSLFGIVLGPVSDFSYAFCK